MRWTWAVAGAAALVVAAAAGGAVARSGADPGAAARPDPAVTTAPVQRGTLSAMVSLSGTLAFRAAPDGSPYVAINQASGTYTSLPAAGDEVACGDELHRVDDRPVLLLCGPVPAYRDLRVGDAGNDVRQLNANLHALGYDAAAGVELAPDDDAFGGATATALEALQRATGLPVTGELGLRDAVVLPEPVRITAVAAQLGGPAQPATALLHATSDAPEVQAALEASQRGEVQVGDRALVLLPGNTSATGRVDRIGAAVQASAGPGGDAGPVTFPVTVALDDLAAADDLDRAPVQVEVTTQGVDDALSVPVTAIVGRTGGGYAVEVVHDGGRREVVAVELGLVDSTAGRVQVDGELAVGDHVVVPSS
jgi:peptidoglycan hydrolase-like protein with peptidoglycan-binding domain